MAEMFEAVTDGPVALRFTAFDGSSAGPQDAAYGLHLRSPRGAAYLATAPGDLGMARAYVAGDLDLVGAHPADPYRVLAAMGRMRFRVPPPRTLAAGGADARHRPAAATAATRRRRRCPAGVAWRRACGTPGPATPRPSTTTTTCPTPSTSTCSARR